MTTRKRSSKPLYLGTDTATRKPLHLSPHWLETHLQVIGPPDSGKSRFLFWIFQQLSRVPDATLVLLNPKGDLARHARDWAISHGHTKRLVWFDPAESNHLIGYNPLRPNLLPVHAHAKAAREAFRSAWGQASFDETPQLARLLYLSLAVTRALELPISSAVRLLRSDPGASSFRKAVLPKLTDPFLMDALIWYDSLNERRQEELAASTLARLEAFVSDPLICRMFTSPRSLDLGEIIANHGILLLNLEIGKPLRIDDVVLLGRFIVNDLLGHVFARTKRDGPVYLILDEVQNFATHDLCSVLDMGRELRLHCILAHQNLAQLRGHRDDSRHLYDSVMGCARTKVLFGGLSVEDLEVLTREVAIDQYDPYKVKDELKTLILDPVESTRKVLTFGFTVGGSTGSSFGTSRATTRGQSVGVSITNGISTSRGVSSSHGVASTENGETVTETETETVNHGESSNFGQSLHNTASHSETDATQCTEIHTRNMGLSFGFSQVPFYEYEKHWMVSSRTFLTEQEFLTMQLQKLKAQPKAHCFVKVPGQRGRFVALPWITIPWISGKAREAGLQRVFDQPFYSTPEQYKMLESKPNILPENPADDESFTGPELLQPPKTRKKRKK